MISFKHLLLGAHAHSGGLKYRHNESINIVYFDGHDKNLSKSDAYSTTNPQYKQARCLTER